MQYKLFDVSLANEVDEIGKSAEEGCPSILRGNQNLLDLYLMLDALKIL